MLLIKRPSCVWISLNEYLSVQNKPNLKRMIHQMNRKIKTILLATYKNKKVPRKKIRIQKKLVK